MKGTLILQDNKWYVDDGFFMTYPLDPDFKVTIEKDGDLVNFEIKSKKFEKNDQGLNFAYLVADIKNG